jgi:hypothetical protein
MKALAFAFIIVLFAGGGCASNGGGNGDGSGGVGDGGGTRAASDCTGSFHTSCDVPNDNGAHTCSDFAAISTAGVEQANTWCTNPTYVGGTVLPCCNHAGAVARCVFSPTEGGTSTEWFLSGSVAAAQSACAGKSGAFTAL